MIKSALVLLTLLTFSLTTCPEQCNCSYDNSFDCSLCVAKYYRFYSLDDDACYCIDSYGEMFPTTDSCRPNICLTYGSSGCLTCPTNWALFTSDNLYYTCACKQNYELDANGACVCMSGSAPTSYYQSVAYSFCKPCPSGCTCSELGCVQCDQFTHRTISQELGLSLCECASPYIEINGICDAYFGCTISGVTVDCTPQSLRRKQSTYGKWVCISSYTDVNGTCQCVGARAMMAVYQDSDLQVCACQSRLYPTQYYEYLGVCAICPRDCFCSNSGCVLCLATAHRQIVGTGCTCVFPYVEVASQCVCAQPYFLMLVDGVTTCVCLDRNPALLSSFTSSYDHKICYRCPTGCTCDHIGCNSCTPESLRVIESSVDYGSYTICSKCDETAILVDNVCVCPPLSDYADGKCTCREGTYINLSDPRRCILCPPGCTCDATGCSNCPITRDVVLVGTYNICNCHAGAVEINGVCQCVFPSTVSQYGVCLCYTPYYPLNNVCKCKSALQPAAYYYDSIMQVCYPCPAGCVCSEEGCVSCVQDALRVVVTTPAGTKICPCLQTAMLDNNICTYCSNTSMVANGQCLACSECATCDVLGCTSCNSDAALVNHNCVCLNPSFVNIEGTCMCSLERFLNKSSSLCVDCPKYCWTCLINSNNKFQCTSCRSGVNRANAVATNCSCSDGYKESSPAALFCCPAKCKTCDSTGCLTCSSQAHRVLSGRDCVCMPTYVDAGNGMCGCPSRTVTYGGICLNCPVHCYQCAYNTSMKAFHCTSCAPNVNRNVSSPYCQCLPNFYETAIQNVYCAPVYCINPDLNTGRCLKCVYSREIDSNGWCICPDHYYPVGPNGTYGLCKKCSLAIVGCIDCSSNMRCLLCNTTGGYHLIVIDINNAVCKTSANQTDLLYIQTKNGVLIHIKLNSINSQYPTIKSVLATSYSVYATNPDTTDNSSVSLTVGSYRKLGVDVLEVNVSNPDYRLDNQLLEFKYTLVNYTTRYLRDIAGVDPIGEFQGIEEYSYTYQPLLYANADVTQGNSWQYILTNVVVVVLILAGLISYMLGLKHNQLLFFLQTMALLAYNIDIKAHYEETTFLYALKGVYYQFGEQSSFIPIPDGYLESSFGNFSYLQTDGNIFRVADILMIIAVFIGIVIAIFRALYYCLRSLSIIDNLSKRTKKWIYRALEFFYKTCMYPLLFFSLVNLRNWDSAAMIGSNTFKLVSIGFSLFFVAAYALVTIWQVSCETTAKINKIENASEFVTSLLAAVTLTWTIQSDLFLLLIIVFCIRGAVYLASRRMLLRDFVKPDYMKGACVVFEIVSVCLIKNPYLEVLVAFIFLTAAVQIAHQIVVLVLNYEHGRLDKIIQQTKVEDEKTSFNNDTIVIMGRTATVFPAQSSPEVDSQQRMISREPSLVDLDDENM